MGRGRWWQGLVGGISMAALAVGSAAAAETKAAKEPKPVAEAGGAAAVDFRDVEQLARENPDFAIQVYRMAAQTCAARGQADRGVALYRQALRVKPGDMLTVEELADAQIVAGHRDEAMETWGGILAAAKDDFGTKMRYASFLSRVGEYDQAIVVMREIVAKQPDNPATRFWIVDTYVRQGNPVEATKELQGMLKQFPQQEQEITQRLQAIATQSAPQTVAAEPKSAPKAKNRRP